MHENLIGCQVEDTVTGEAGTVLGSLPVNPGTSLAHRLYEVDFPDEIRYLERAEFTL